jgi:hypothetical protein
LAGLAVLGAGGAASWPGGLAVGLPVVETAVAVAAAALLLVLAARGTAGVLLGFAPAAAILLVGLRPPGFGALTGPALLALALAGVALLVWPGAGEATRIAPSWARMREVAFLPAVFLLYTLAAGRVQLQVGPEGDEPHYIMVTDSLLRDGDLSLEKDYAEGRYLAFHDYPLEPHYRLRGKGGAIYSLHAVGLSLLLLPAYALGGYPAASIFMALLAALLAREIRALARAVSGRDDVADAVGWVVALSPPLIHYAGLIFTEVPAALLVAFALRRARGESWTAGRALAVALALAFLPWLNVRYVPMAALLGAYVLWTRAEVRSRWILVLTGAVSGLAIALYHLILYGFFDPTRVYGRRPELALSALAEGFPGLLLDQEFGLLVYAPLFALALPGFFQLWRKDRRESALLLGLVAAVALTAGTWPMWRGGFNPPARFLVPLVPVLALATAAALARGLTAGGALLVGWSVWVGLAGASEPRLVHRDRDGTAPFFRAVSGAEEWTRLLPGYVLGDSDRHRLALVWAGAVLLALPWRARPVTPARVAVATLGFMAAAGLASSISHGRTGGRDAVRLVGRPALRVPGWTWVRAPARWGPEVLDWGPLFEPHRHPEGVAVGARLPLATGRYRLLLQGERLGTAWPLVEVQPDRAGSPWRTAVPAGEGAWEMEVGEGDGPVTLRLRGGGPFLLREVALDVQP